jgi:hypothetical protein
MRPTQVPERTHVRRRAGSSQLSHRGRGEVVIVLAIVALVPARPKPEDEPPAADVVDGAGHVGQQVRVAVADPGHQAPQLDALGDLGERAEHREGLEVLPRRIACIREEVVEIEHDVHPGVLGTKRSVA